MTKAIVAILVSGLLAVGCGTDSHAPNSNHAGNLNSNGAAGTNTASPAPMKLSVVDRPQKIKDLMAGRGAQDDAAPTLKIVKPRSGATIANSTVKVKLDISGDLKGYKPHLDMETKTGNHIHVILDNQPYEAYYNLEKEFELRNVNDGEHTLRVFPSRPWHESYKSEGAFQMVRFTVQNGKADTTKPVTANGAPMSNANADPNLRPAEGKEMKESTAGAVDASKPLLTYSRPKGEYKGEDAQAIMIDFWLANAKLTGDGGEYKVRYSVDNGEPQMIEKWAPVWLTGWTPGTHSIKLELIDKAGNVVDNGGYNSTTREINISN